MSELISVDQSVIVVIPQEAWIYGRTSTEKQEIQLTIESQVDEVKTRVVTDGNLVSEERIFLDDGWSGANLVRPSLDTLRDCIERGEVKLLYVYDLGRLSRDFTYQLLLLKEFEDAGVKVISLHDINPENGEQSFMRNIMGAFHDYERVKIAERFRRGKLFKSRSKILINGQAIYGYDYIKKTDTTLAKLEVNTEEERVIKLIREKFGNEGVSVKGIQKYLHEENIYPRKRKRDYWAESSIKRILNCEVYVTGVIYYNKSKAIEPTNPIKKDKYRKVKNSSRLVRPRNEWVECYHVEPITPDEGLHERILKRLEYNKKYAKKNRKYDYLLSGLIHCQCGYPRAGDGSNVGGHFYYRCSERVNKVPAENRQCHLRGVNACVLDDMVWTEIHGRLTNPTLLRRYAESWITKKIDSQSNVEEKHRLNNLLTDIEEEFDRLDTAYKLKLLDPERYKNQLNETKMRKLVYENKLQKLEAQSIKLPDINTDRLIEEAEKVIGQFNFSNKKQIIQDIIDKIVVKERSEVEVWGHINLQTSPVLAEELGYEPECRNCRSSKRRKINPL